MHAVIQREANPLANLKRRRRCGISDVALALSHRRHRIPRSRYDACRLLRRGAAGAVLLENDVTTRLLLVMTEAGVVEMVAVDVNVVAAPVVVLLTCSLLCIGAAAAGPAAEANVTHRHKDAASFRTGEESVPFVGAIACSPTCR